MTSLGGAPSPCTLGYWWGLEGTELTAFALGCWLCWALGTVLPGHRGTPTTFAPSRRAGFASRRQQLWASVHYLSSTFSTFRQLRPQPGANTN